MASFSFRRMETSWQGSGLAAVGPNERYDITNGL